MNTDINLQTKVADLLESYPYLEDKLIELSPMFSKLRNPILRRTVAKVTNLQQAAEIAKISPISLIRELRNTVGLTDADVEYEPNDTESVPPPWFNESKISIYYNACPIIEAGKSPMQDILNLSKKVKENEILQILTPFKPIPIINILKSQGFKNWSKDENNYFIKEKIQ